MSMPTLDDPPRTWADALAAELRAPDVTNVPESRQVRRRYSRALANADWRYVYDVATALLANHGYRWIACELVAEHKEASRAVDVEAIEALGRGMASWGAVDSFGRTLAGPAWVRGQLADADIIRWAESPGRWWRRAALVSTVALNRPAQGGQGDAERTLMICRMLATDRDDMIYKALSWALRELVPHDPAAVQDFIVEHDAGLAAQVKREVRNKLATGLKNPRRGRG